MRGIPPLRAGLRGTAAVLALASAGAGVLVAAGAVPAASAEASSTSVPQCRTGQLAAALRGRNGAAGSTYATLTLRNVSRRTCEVGGFAGVSYPRMGTPVPIPSSPS